MGSFEISDPEQKPALDPPNGVVPNFANPSNRNYLGYVTVIPSIILTSTVVLLRIYAKIRFSKRLDLEDCKFSSLVAIFDELFLLTGIDLIVVAFVRGPVRYFNSLRLFDPTVSESTTKWYRESTERSSHRILMSSEIRESSFINGTYMVTT
jgi:hypothetical protein